MAAALTALALLAAAAPAEPVDLELVLGVDASGSIDGEEWALQMQGYAEAFRNRAVHDAIASGRHGAIAVTLVQWSGYVIQHRAVEWTRLDGAAGAQALAARIEAAPRMIFGGGTSLSGIIDHGARLFADNGFEGDRRVIDISGDGANNRGRDAAEARDAAAVAGIVINGLPILGTEAGLDLWYQDNVIGGPGAFLVAARDFRSFGQAILAKLLREIAQAE